MELVKQICFPFLSVSCVCCMLLSVTCCYVKSSPKVTVKVRTAVKWLIQRLPESVGEMLDSGALYCRFGNTARLHSTHWRNCNKWQSKNRSTAKDSGSDSCDTMIMKKKDRSRGEGKTGPTSPNIQSCSAHMNPCFILHQAAAMSPKSVIKFMVMCFIKSLQVLIINVCVFMILMTHFIYLFVPKRQKPV